MILQALTKYYERISLEQGAAREGFEKKEIPFIVVLNRKGVFRGLVDTRDGEEKKRARAFIVPKAVKRTGNVAANLLWDNATYVLGRPKLEERKDDAKVLARAKEQHESFFKRIHDTFPPPIEDEGVVAVVAYLKAADFRGIFEHPLWKEIEESGANLSFMLEGDLSLVCERAAVRDAIRSPDRERETHELSQCLITGEMAVPARLHTAIKGVWDARTSGANIVSFNLPAFCSFGKDQGFNAPVGEAAEHAYSTALNGLLAKDSRQRLQVGDASTVFWAEKGHKLEEWFAGFFGEAPKGESGQDDEAIRALYAGPASGAPPLEADYTRFFVLGLSPNASRISIRFWYEGTVAEVSTNIKQHFEDCAIVHGDKQPEHLSLYRLLISTVPKGKEERIQPNLSGEIMKSILTGTPYPAILLASVARRIRAEREVTYPRASLIKGVLVRDSRYYRKNGKEVGMALDTENSNIGYRLGRLFATLEKIQEEASPGINATIRDRFYGSASSTPVTAFPHLMKLKNHHVAKLENRGRAVNLERLIGDIVAGIQSFPSQLSLQDQGRFSIGYYHQRQDFFAIKINNKEM